jgi:hypothetical protein
LLYQSQSNNQIMQNQLSKRDQQLLTANKALLEQATAYHERISKVIAEKANIISEKGSENLSLKFMNEYHREVEHWFDAKNDIDKAKRVISELESSIK